MNSKGRLTALYSLSPTAAPGYLLPAAHRPTMAEQQTCECAECGSAFTLRKNLYKHCRKFHGSTIQVIPAKTVQRVATSERKVATKSRNCRLTCPECGARLPRQNALRMHLKETHKIALNQEKFKFSSDREFQEWKRRYESQNICAYILDTSPKNLSTGEEKRYYHCHRSFSYQTQSSKRKPKSIGSNKINSCCPSIIELSIKKDEYVATFWTTHVGHSLDIGRTFLQKETRAEIADQLSKGVSFQRVIDDIRSSVSKEEGLQRVHLTRRKDLHNILRDFNIPYATKRPWDDASMTDVGDMASDEPDPLDVSEEVCSVVKRENQEPGSRLSWRSLSESDTFCVTDKVGSPDAAPDVEQDIEIGPTELQPTDHQQIELMPESEQSSLCATVASAVKASNVTVTSDIAASPSMPPRKSRKVTLTPSTWVVKATALGAEEQFEELDVDLQWIGFTSCPGIFDEATLFEDVQSCWVSNTSNDVGSEIDEDDRPDTPAPSHITVSRRVNESCLPDYVPAEIVQCLEHLDEQDDAGMLRNLPEDQVHFDWQSDPSTFQGVRETFTGQAGPTFPVSEMSCPLDAFQKIFDDGLINWIVIKTNRYAQQLMNSGSFSGSTRLTRWNPVTSKEIWVFLGIVMLQSLSPLPVESHYWHPTVRYLSMPYFKELMPFNRFSLINKCLHFVDSSLLSEPELFSAEQHKIFKIQPIIDYLNNKFSSLYYPDQEVALDESLLQWKGRLNLGQKITTKTAGMGIKSYELCESKTGYLWRFKVYAGKNHDEAVPQDQPGTTSQIVYELAHPLFNKGHTIVMDNLYNSPLLSRALKLNKTDTMGTLCMHRAFVPDSLKRITEAEMRVGEIACSQTKDISILVWRDVNLVSMISTFHPVVVGGSEKYGSFKYKPHVVLDYDLAMGGVDKKDQVLSAFPMEKVSYHIWYKKLFRRLVNISILNSSVLYGFKTKITQRSFREALAVSIIEKYRDPFSSGSLVSIIATPTGEGNRVKLTGGHYLEKGKWDGRCRCCKVLKLKPNVRTSWQCDSCKVPLCAINCFKEWHTT